MLRKAYTCPWSCFQWESQHYCTALHIPVSLPDPQWSPFNQGAQLPLPPGLCTLPIREDGEVRQIHLYSVCTTWSSCKTSTCDARGRNHFALSFIFICLSIYLFMLNQLAVQTALFLAFSLIPHILHLTELPLSVDRTLWPANIKCMMSLSNLTPVFHPQVLIFHLLASIFHGKKKLVALSAKYWLQEHQIPSWNFTALISSRFCHWSSSGWRFKRLIPMCQLKLTNSLQRLHSPCFISNQKDRNQQ